MGNSVPHISLAQIELTPGNLLVSIVDKRDQRKAQSLTESDSDFARFHNLIRARVVRLGPKDQQGQFGATNLQEGDEVWIRARKGYPIDVGDGERLFVFNVWDVALVAVN